MLFLRNLLKLPSPIDLGWSDHNALESEEWSDNPKGKTWEDWHRTVKVMHPIKYFIAETFADWIKYKVWYKVWLPYDKFQYWLRSHIVPSRRYHMLDLRQPLKRGGKANHDAYRYGWVDVDQKILYAIFNLLGEYLNKENPTDLSNFYSLEQINNDPMLKNQHDSFLEAKAIYHWWTIERAEQEEIKEKLLNDWHSAKKAKASNTEVLWDMMRQIDENEENKTEEMLLRLLKIRRTLWT